MDIAGGTASPAALSNLKYIIIVPCLLNICIVIFLVCIDGSSDQSQDPRRQHSMISRSPAFSRLWGQAPGVGKQSKVQGVLKQTGRSPASASERVVLGVGQ